jgi:hypothetical protein
VKLGDPDVVSNPSEYQKLSQSVAELDEVYPISLLSLFFKKKLSLHIFYSIMIRYCILFG